MVARKHGPPYPLLHTGPMEEALREAAVDDWRQALAQSVADQRQKARDLLSGGQQRLRELEGQLQQRIDALSRQLVEEQSQSQQAPQRCFIVKHENPYHNALPLYDISNDCPTLMR